MSAIQEEILAIKCVVVGDSGVGKTELFKRFKNDPYSPEFKATVGVDHYIRRMTVANRAEAFDVTWWDTAGQERFHAIIKAHYNNAHVFFVMFDITDEQSFKNLSIRMKDIPADTHKVLVATKLDLAEKRVVDQAKAQQFAAAHNMTYFETSAKMNTNVDDLLNDTLKAVVNKKYQPVLPKTPKDAITAVKRIIGNTLSTNKDPYHARVIGASKIDKTRVPTSIKKVYQWCMAVEQGKLGDLVACQKINKLVTNYELRDKGSQSVWDKIIIALRNIFAGLKLTLSQQERNAIFTPVKEQMSCLNLALC